VDDDDEPVVVVAEDEDVPGGGWRDDELPLPGVVLMVGPEESSDEAETFDTTDETMDRSTNPLAVHPVKKGRGAHSCGTDYPRQAPSL